MIDALFQFLGKMGMKDPLHPPITHMPIGLVVGAAIFFLVALIFKKKNLFLTARHVSILAFIFAFPTILLGVIDWIHFYHAAMFTPIKIKMVLAAVVLVVLGTGIIIGSEVKIHSLTMVILYSIAFVAVVGLGYFGSGIIYGRGLGTPIPKIPKQHQQLKTSSTNKIGFEEKPGNKIPLDLMLVSETGAEFKLRDLLKEPAALCFVYYKCPDACTLLLTGIAETLRSFADSPGPKPLIITISIDGNESASDAMKSKTIGFESIQKPYPRDRWLFLRGNTETVKKLTDAMGLHFEKRGEDYDHPLGLVFVSPSGKIVRYILGTEFLPVDLSMSMMEASKGIIKPTIARTFRICFKYDPKSRHFVFNVLRVSATVIFTLLGIFILYLIISGNRKRRKGAA